MSGTSKASIGPVAIERRRVAAARRRSRRLLTTLLTTVLVAVGLSTAAPARADTAPAPGLPETVAADALPTWQINGVVWSQVLVGDTVYATGSFTRARPPGVAPGGAGEVDALNILAYDITTGNRVAAFTHTLNGQGLAITASPDGSRIYVGGDFTSVDGVLHNHVGAFNTATGALDNSFSANVSSQVKALTASNTTLYIGGGYGAVNGSTRSNLAAVTASTGSLLPWTPSAQGGVVWAMVLAPDGSRVIVGGSFTALSGQPAYGMGSLSTSNGAVLQWDANQAIRDAGANAAISSLRTDGRQIFGSGYSFDRTTGNFEGTFAAEPNTGSITTVNPCHGDTYDVLPVAEVLYEVSHTHDCTWTQSFADTEPRVRWQRALAWTIAPTGTATGPDSYGWNFNGYPDSTQLHWYPQIPAGTYTGQGQAGWSLAGNSEFVAMGGEFPRVNGTPQQGLVRFAIKSIASNKRGPSYTTNPSRPVPATTATSFKSGTAQVGFGTAWDYDNESLTYDVFRNNGTTPVYTTTIKSSFWILPSAGFLDTGLAPGSTHTYQVRITDPFGNVQWSPRSNPVTIASSTPVRLLDTRNGTGAPAEFAAAGSTTDLLVAGEAGIPGTAKAVVFNATVTQPEAAGFLTVFPCGEPRPTTSNINYSAGQTIPSMVVVMLPANGRICFYSSKKAHLIADVNGYFPQVSDFEPMSPRRLVDSRSTGAPPVKLPAGSTFSVNVAPRYGIPEDAAAASLNIAVTQPNSSGHITTFPCGSPRPKASTLNYLTGQTLSNALLAKTGSGGNVCIYTTSSLHVVVDVGGWFPSDTDFRSLIPERLLDTRSGIGHPPAGIVTGGSEVELTVTQVGASNIPADAGAVVLNVTVTGPQSSGYVTVYPCGEARPTASNLNYVKGTTIANAVISKVGTGGKVCLFTNVSTHLVADVTGWFPPLEFL